LASLWKSPFSNKISAEPVFAKSEQGDTGTTKPHTGLGYSQTSPNTSLEAFGNHGSREGVQTPSDFYRVDSAAFQLHLLPSLTPAGINKVELLHEQDVK